MACRARFGGANVLRSGRGCPATVQEQPGTVKSIGYYTALAIVVANMIGTGVFTTLGLQATELGTSFALLTLWVLGGAIALCGALSYAELAAALRRSGGEYHFLSRIYHPVLGGMAGWVSMVVGFAAPVALAAMALGRYAASLVPVPPPLTAVIAILAVTGLHAVNVQLGTRFQVVTTALKLVLIAVFCAAGLLAEPVAGFRIGPPGSAAVEVFSSGFALSLIYVSYAYSGWNAATYVASEVYEPQRVLPRALLHGTVLVTLLYVLLNLVFLRTIPMAQLAGTVEVGALSAFQVFGPRAGAIISAMLCLLLISTISAMVLAGPRVVQVMGEDLPALRALSARTRGGAPYRAILLQQALALGFVLTDSFEGVLSYAGFTLNLFTMLTVVGVFVLRHMAPGLPRPYRVWGYPFTPGAFVIVSLVTLGAVVLERPMAAFAGIGTVLAASLLGRARGRP
jgi:APA family basic amino acid/polyamine antiporter